MAGLLLAVARVSAAQTADEIVEKHIAAIGGRAALKAVTSRTISGRITLTTPAGDVSGPVEVTTQAPNKARTLVTLDLSALGAGQMTYDERFDGSTGYLIDTLQGNREITGAQLHSLRNDTFPTPFLDYKSSGMSVELVGKEKVGDREAYALKLTPKLGPPSYRYIDAGSYLEIRHVITTSDPTAGEFELTMDLSDYREVEGIKVPFELKATSLAQTFSVTMTKVVHNQPIDATLFSRPSDTK
jgi:hypothetical protein